MHSIIFFFTGRRRKTEEEEEEDNFERILFLILISFKKIYP